MRRCLFEEFRKVAENQGMVRSKNGFYKAQGRARGTGHVVLGGM